VNATNIASTLAFTNVGITATSEIDYVDPVNLGSTVQFGPTYYNLTNTAPITSIQANVTFSSYPFAVFSSVSSQVNLAASFYNASNALLGPSQLTGNAESVNVLSNSANLQQAIDFTQSSLSQSTITAPFGTATSLAFNSDANMILSGGLLSGSVAMNQANSHLELVGSNFQLNTGSGSSRSARGRSLRHRDNWKEFSLRETPSISVLRKKRPDRSTLCRCPPLRGCF
jgi:hypothetical protein